ncbi:hypothetical protein Sme01_26050 [Sphaerisporangium melleum]|uniref:Uncharacterized protein n=1 Tax=Sphaerisporangium melleum TaxID=321316 RepID=A0A917VD08_9ACTN|nr:hypothetical protein [Sphaerisporangium melleum]GGK64048.1 hypothetical protein GCM10007964_03890 [Sphaerisporangium melleum]GII70129.1 hypothetical protein Sme01_26050 [Sphaerisporangium melleum]
MNESQTGGQATGGGDLLAGARDLGSAIEEHARVLTEAPDDYPRVVEAVNHLRATAIAYADLCAREAGWGDPFSNLASDRRADEEAEAEEPAGAAGEQAPVVDLEVDYRIRVHDVAGAARLIGEEVSPDLPGAASDVVARLFQRDGWDPSRYGDIFEVLDHTWSCGPDDPVN